VAPPRHGEGDHPQGGGGGGEQSSGPPPSVPLRETATSPSRGGLRRIALAAVAGAHGVKGELRLKLFSDSVESLSRHEQLYLGGVERRLLGIRDSGKTAVARFEGISDRSTAENLRGSLVEVDRSKLPPLEAGEYYHADLIGSSAVDRHGNEVGIVSAVENYGAGDLLEIEKADGTRLLIPFRRGIAEIEGDKVLLDPEFLV
jgi:16S rRNA processing protein RimM